MTATDFIQDYGFGRDQVEDAVAHLDARARKIGLKFEPSFDPKTLDATVWPLNPRYASPRLNPRNFVHVRGEIGGVLKTRSATRLYNWYDGKTFASESRNLGVYYDFPEHARHTDQAIILAPIADRIHGRVAYNGAVYIAKELRGPRDELSGGYVSSIVSAMSRMLALYLFDVDWCVATASKEHIGYGGPAEHYGWKGFAYPPHAERVGTLSADVQVMWSRREDILEEAERIRTDRT